MEEQNRKLRILVYIVIVGIFLFFLLDDYGKERSLLLETSPIAWLKPHDHHHEDSVMYSSHHTISYSRPTRAREDMWVKGFTYSINNARQTVLHHAVLAILNKPDLFCPNRNGYHLLGFGEDQLHTSSVPIPQGYAILIPKNSELLFYTMLHNPKPPVGYGENHYNVSSSLKLELASKDEIAKLKPVQFIRLDLTDKPCGNEEESYVFKVPGNVSEYTFGEISGNSPTSSYTFKESGKIIYMGGHMHGWEGGKHISVYINGKLLKKYVTRKAPDDPYRYDTDHQEENLSINRGDVISITATYENKEEEPLTGAMAMLGLYFAKD